MTEPAGSEGWHPLVVEVLGRIEVRDPVARSAIAKDAYAALTVRFKQEPDTSAHLQALSALEVEKAEKMAAVTGREFSYDVLLAVSGADEDRLFAFLEEGLEARVIEEPAPAVFLSQFAADGLELSISFWIADPQNGQNNVRSDANLAILRTLDAAGVSIPFPQRVVRNA